VRGRWIALVVLAALAALAIVLLARREGPEDAMPPSAGNPAAAESATTPEATLGAPPSRAARGDPAPAEAGLAPAPKPVEEVGAWRTVGVVRGPGGAAVEGASVVASIHLADEVHAIGEARTGADGTYVIAVAARADLSRLEQTLASVHVRAWATGFKPARDAWMDAPPAGGELRVDFTMEPGATLHGRVVDPDAKGVPWAAVRICLEGPEKHEYFSTDGRGEFAIDIAGGGSGWIGAYRNGVGTAVAPLVLVAGRDAAIPDLVLRGEALIAGRAVHPDGTPARFLAVDLRSASDAPPAPAAGCAGFAESIRRARLQVRTDGGGRFRASGLRAGRWRVMELGDRREDAEAPEDVHATGETDVVLVSRQHRLVLRVVDGDGRTVRGASFRAHGETEDVTFSAAGQISQPGGIEPLDLEAGMRLEVSVTAGDLSSGAVPYDFPKDAWERETTVVLTRRAEPGRLELIVAGPYGKPMSVWRAEIRAPLTGGVVTTHVFGPAEGGLTPFLEPGEYELTVWPGRGEDVLDGVPLLPVRERVVVPLGAVSRHFVHAEVGGRLRLTLRVPTGKSLDGERTGVTLRAPTGGEPRHLSPTSFFAEGKGRATNGLLVAGTPVTHAEAIAPGRWTLSIDSPGYAPAERLVEVEMGSTVDVEITLEPR
jgi:hypothetical protein